MHINQRLASIAAAVQTHLQEMAAKHPNARHDARYRWEHTLRVAQYGKILAQAEDADVEVVVAACLLHDIAHFEAEDAYQDHGRSGAALARPILSDLGYLPQQIDQICFAIAAHVDGQAGFEYPDTLEARCVTDADNIDRFGAYRILQWTVPEMADLPKLADKLEKRLEKLLEYRSRPKMLETDTGDLLFKQQLDLQIQVFRSLIEESRLSSLPLLDE